MTKKQLGTPILACALGLIVIYFLPLFLGLAVFGQNLLGSLSFMALISKLWWRIFFGTLLIATSLSVIFRTQGKSIKKIWVVSGLIISVALLIMMSSLLMGGSGLYQRLGPSVQQKKQVQFFSGCSDVADLWSPLSEEERRQECIKILNEQTADLKNAGFEPKDCQLIEAEVAHCSPGLGVHLVCSYNCEKRSK